MVEAGQSQDDAATNTDHAGDETVHISARVFEKMISVDITKAFMQATSFLKAGELAKTNDFQLREAMNAIELMEPKMDLGMVPVNHTLGLDYAIAHNNFDHENTSIPLQIAIFDASMAMLATLIGGANPDQTVYTNILLQSPTSIANTTLKAMITGIKTLTRYVRYTIELGAVVHEEDYCATCYADSTIVDTDNSSSIDELSEVLKELKAANSVDPVDKALYNRLVFLRHFLTLLQALVPPPNIMAVNSDEAFVVGFGVAAHSIAVMEKTFAEIKSSYQLGSRPPPTEDDGLYTWLPVFQPDVNRHLSPGSFPRALDVLSILNSFKFWDEHLKFLMHIVADFPKRNLNADNLLNYVRLATENDADPLIRSVMQIVIVPFNDSLFGVQSYSEIVFRSIQNTTYPPVMNRDIHVADNHDFYQLWQNTLDMITRVHITVLQQYGLNLTQQRERMASTLDDVTVIYTETDRTDQIFTEYLRLHYPKMAAAKPNAISCYVAQILVSLMRYYIILGFKLDLYSMHELPYIYWYLGEVVALWKFRLSNQARDYLQADRNALIPYGDKRIERRAKHRDLQIQPRLIELELSFLRDRVEASFCEGYVSLLSGFVSAGFLVIPSDERNRYGCRFKPFSCVPGFIRISYDVYLQQSQFYALSNLPPSKCYERAITTWGAALENLGFILNHDASDAWALKLVKIAKQNMIASKLLRADPSRKPSFEFSEDQVFPNIKLV